MVAGDRDSLIRGGNDDNAGAGDDDADASDEEHDLPSTHRKGRKRCRKGANFHLCLPCVADQLV